MDVELYVYDLSKGLARQMSRGFLGIQIDAVYHTSLVFGGIEYFFGAGVQTAYPGRTHHGPPMEAIKLGTTQLDLDTILEYLESLKQTYTAESYDLFMHNCNNFTHDFAMFLVGRGIPAHITSLPQTVLNTPFGQMLKPQLDQAMRGVTQAPVPPAAKPSAPRATPVVAKEHPSAVSKVGRVHNITGSSELGELLAKAKSSCAVIFFTSSTCAPCKIAYPAYDSLAEELGKKVTLIKVDLNHAPDIGPRYQVRATPTFMTFLHGEKVEEWSGADPSKLLSNVRLLVQMAHPTHPHSQLRLRSLQQPHNKPVTYAKVPPLDKLLAKLGGSASEAPVVELRGFVEHRFSSEPNANAALPDMPALSSFFKSCLENMESSSLFALVDLLRLALIDARVSGYLAEEPVHESTILALVSHVNGLDDKCPYNLRIVTVQAACNLFTSALYPPKLMSDTSLAPALVTLVASSLLDEDHSTVRVSAGSLAFNIAAWDHKRRLDGEADLLNESSQVELAASLVEAIGREKADESLKVLLMALGLLAYSCRQDGELKDVLGAMEARRIIQGKKLNENKDLIEQVAQVVC
jgi:thiol-disulfide isomerase/thioredoxin